MPGFNHWIINYYNYVYPFLQRTNVDFKSIMDDKHTYTIEQGNLRIWKAKQFHKIITFGVGLLGSRLLKYRISAKELF